MAIPENEPVQYLTKEEIELKLEQIGDMQVQINRLITEITLINKRITRLQGQKEDRK